MVAQYTSTEPVLWLSPNSPLTESGGVVEEWISENSAALVAQTELDNRPVVNPAEFQLVNHRTIHFSGEQFFKGTLSVPQPLTIISVFRIEEGEGQYFLYDTPSRLFLLCNPQGNIKPGILPSYSSPVPNEFFIITMHVVDDGYGRFYENGELKVEGNENRSIDGTLFFGADEDEDRHFQGSVAEFIVYEEALGDNELFTVYDSLKAKYAPPPELGDDLNLIPGCTRKLQIEDRFKSYKWFLLDDMDEEVLLSSDSSEQVIDLPGEYILEVTTIFDDVFRDTVEVTSINLNGLSGATVCEGQGVTIDLEATDSSVEVEWSDTSLTGSVVYIEDSGEYGLTVSQPDGCSLNENFEVFDIESVVEINVPEILCTGNEISIVGADFPDISVAWSTGSDSPTIVPAENGLYWVEVENAQGCVAQDTVDIQFAGVAPQVLYASNPLCELETIMFTDESTVSDDSNIAGVEWVIEGDTLQGAEVGYSFSETGNYNLQINVVTDVGCTAALNDTLVVHPLPQVEFSHSLSCTDQSTVFEDSTSIAAGNLSNWLWDFGDGNTAQTANTVFEFGSPGITEVTLTVTSVEGCSDSLTKEIPVYPTPQASFEWTATCSGQVMHFLSTTDTGLTGAVNYAWNINEVVYPGESVQHLFSEAGSYNASLQVWTTINGVVGCTDEIVQEVSVSEVPEVQFSSSPACSGQSFTLTDQTIAGQSDTVVSWEWSTQGIVIDTTSTAQWVFENIGAYPVTLSVLTAAGCDATATDLLEVGSSAAPQIDFSPEIGLPPLEVTFTNVNSYGQNHFWDFGDEGTSGQESPIYTFEDTGLHVIELVVFDDAGCFGFATANVWAIQPLYDVSVESVECSMENGLMSVSCVIGNYNNHRLKSAQLSMQLGNGTSVVENWSGDLASNQLTTYTFQSQLQYDENINESYFCVQIGEPNGVESQFDDVSENNKRCKSFSTAFLEVFQPFPNPADDHLVQLFALEESAEVSVRLQQPDGKVLSEFTNRYARGINRLEIETAHLSSGVYFLNVATEDEWIQNKILIIRN